MPRNIELKARSCRQDEIRKILYRKNADFRGTDHQIDTYFNVPHGRMKLREGNIENSLIHYQRPNQKNAKQADILLYHPTPDPALKKLLTAALQVWKVVDKIREIYFIGNVKFHIDRVRGLGTFVEIEAIDKNGDLGLDKIQAQCDYYQNLLKIKTKDLVAESYSDLVSKVP